MADRFWVGGSASWDSTAGSKWALTSGGTGGEAVPTSTDDVFIDANSGAVTITIATATATCNNLNFTGFTGTFAGNTTGIQISGSLTMVSGMTRTFSGTILFNATSTGKTITLGGKTIGSQVTFNGVGGAWTMQDTFNASGAQIVLTNGSLNTNGVTVTCAIFSSSNSNVRSLTLGASTINVTVNSGSCWSLGTSTNLTLDAGTSTINMTNTGTLDKNFSGGSKTYYNVNLSGATIISGSNTFNNLTLPAGKTITITSGTTQSAGVFTFLGTSGNLITIQPSGGTAYTLQKLSNTLYDNVAADYISISFCNATGASFVAMNSTDGGNNSSWTFGNTNTRFWVGNGGNWSDAINHWTVVSKANPLPSAIPTSAMSVYFDAGSFSSSGQTINIDTAASCLDMDWTGVTNTPALGGASALSIYGSLTLIGSMTRTYTGALTFAATSTGKTVTLAANSLASTVVFDGVGGGWTLQDNLNNGSNNITLTNGSLDTGGKTITCGTFASSNSNVRTLILGASAIACSTGWNLATVTNLTFTVGTSVITMTGTSTFAGGGLTYNSVVL